MLTCSCQGDSHETETPQKCSVLDDLQGLGGRGCLTFYFTPHAGCRSFAVACWALLSASCTACTSEQQPMG